MISRKQKCLDRGYVFTTREQFIASDELPEGLLERARGALPGWGPDDLTRHKFVAYDPNDDYQGWMLWGDDERELVNETYAQRVESRE
jgi:hypothetical protein